MEHILIGSFMLCPRLDRAVISNNCTMCEAVVKVEEEYFCNYDELIGSELRIVELVTTLLEMLEEGKTRISLPEITELFPENRKDE